MRRSVTTTSAGRLRYAAIASAPPLHALHLVAEARERERHALAEGVVVVGDEDAGHRGGV